METNVYSVNQAQHLLAQAGRHIRPVTIRWLARTHGIGRKIGRDWLFDDDDIAALLALPRQGRPRKAAQK